jgi:hypothetical protein
MLDFRACQGGEAHWPRRRTPERSPS